MRHAIPRYVTFSALGLAACTTPPATRDHMVATFARQYGFQPAAVDGRDEYCSKRGTHQCVTKEQMAQFMDGIHTIAWVYATTP